MSHILIPVILAIWFTYCTAHVCIISPPQRGGFRHDLNKNASADCIKLQGPCGNMPPDTPPKIAISSGTTYTVVWQKNLDHYNSDRPGYFSIKLGKTADTLREISRVPDDWQPSLSLYTQTVTAPTQPGAYVLQVEYLTNNPKAPPSFYQCTDFLVFPPIYRLRNNPKARENL